MGESHRHHLYGHQLLHPSPAHHGRPPAHHSRLGGVRGGGEIVEVQGGHILRSIGRKDRHSKVFTAKGPRDRRVRLSAHTAIQFYDVQDRLGYDRPSKAVDWLIKNAKAAIDELAELPPCRPMVPNAAASGGGNVRVGEREDPEGETSCAAEEPGEKPLPEAASTYGFATSSFLPPSLDSDAIADTIKSFFPMAAAAATTGATSSPGIAFHSYLPELLPRGGGQAQDLRLSLQSFQDPVLLQQQHHHHHHHPQPTTAYFHHHHHHHQASPAAEQALFSSSSAHLPFESSSAGWSDLSQRMFSWNAPAETGGGGGGSGGYVLVPPQQQAVPLHPVLGQSPFLSQRGPLQSSNSPNVRAWTDPTAAEESPAALSPGPPPFGFAPDAFSGFRIPARIQGEEEHDGEHKKPSSASSASRH